MNKNLLFVYHSYHDLSRSNDFFVEELKKRSYNVTKYHYSEDLLCNIFDIAKNVDTVILWQSDALAPLFSLMGKCVVVVPMYDATGNIGVHHWRMLRGVKVISFSRTLQNRISINDVQSRYLQYFPESRQETTINRDAEGVFFWMRRPVSGPTLSQFFKIIDTWQIRGHIHVAPDPGEDVVRKLDLRSSFSGRSDISVSDWFSSAADYKLLLNKFKYFLAPRLSEGIGMSFLEAMANGMIVLAPNCPTYNEYIIHGVNGYLYENDPSEIRLPSVRIANSISNNAFSTCKAGRREFIDNVDAVIDWALSPSQKVGGVVKDFDTAMNLAKHFLDDMGDYVRLTRALDSLVVTSDSKLVKSRVRSFGRWLAYKVGLRFPTMVSRIQNSNFLKLIIRISNIKNLARKRRN